MSVDYYRNLLISKTPIDLEGIKLYNSLDNIIYEIHLENMYFYFMISCGINILNESFLQHCDSNIILIDQNNCGTSINLVYYNNGDIIPIDRIPDDFVYLYDYYEGDIEKEKLTNSFISLLETGIDKIDKNIYLSKETLSMVSCVYRLFALEHDRQLIPDNVKSHIKIINLKN